MFNALIYHYKSNLDLPRAGIVHRLDKNTSGLLVIAKTIYSYNYLINLFKKRKIIKEYDVIVVGRLEQDGLINRPIKRNIYNRTKMTVGMGGKEAITYYKIMTIFNNYTYLRVRIKTGRMHQIRVHFSSILHPVLGDHLYSQGIKGNHVLISNKVNKLLYQFSRPALHSRMLSFIHPRAKKKKTWIVSPPKDMILLINLLYKNEMK